MGGIGPGNLFSSVSSVAVVSMVKPGVDRTPRETSTQALGRAGGWACGEANLAGEQENKLIRFRLKDVCQFD